MELHNIEARSGGFHLQVDACFAGKITGLFGPSGAGKTTLLEIIAGLRKPCAGRIVLDQRAVFDSRQKLSVPARQRQIGYVPQDLALFPHMNAGENIRCGERWRTGANPLPFARVCDVLGVSNLLSQSARTLSGGQKQRVAIARALMARPALLLLDEPLSGIGQSDKESILGLLLHIRDEFGIPMIYVSHAANEMMQLCDAMFVLKKGRIVAQGTPRDLLEEVHHPMFSLRSDVAERALGRCADLKLS